MVFEKLTGIDKYYFLAKSDSSWHFTVRPGKRNPLIKDNETDASIDKAGKIKADLRPIVEHPFRVIVSRFSFVKVRHRS